MIRRNRNWFKLETCIESYLWMPDRWKCWFSPLSLSNIQQICGKILLKYMENLFNCRYNYWKSWKHCDKGEIARFEQFLILSQCFKSHLRQMCQNASRGGKGFILCIQLLDKLILFYFTWYRQYFPQCFLKIADLKLYIYPFNTFRP